MSNTPNAGSPNSGRRYSPVIVLIVGALALAFAALVGPRMIGVLLALAAPPDAPLPDASEVVLVSHENLAYGVDEWVYSIGQDVCEIARFYHDQDGQCANLPPQCALSPAGNVPAGEDVAFCYGDIEFSIFAMRWRFRVASDDALAGTTRFHLSRVVSWTDSLPAETP